MLNINTALQFYNGMKCPIFGFGTYRAHGNEVYEAVKYAIKHGFRHIDTALIYDNENDVGKAIADSMKEFSISRKDLFVVTKLPGSCNRPNLVVPALKHSLKHLKLDYVDLYLMHTPIARQPLSDEIISADGKKNSDGESILEDIHPVDTWKGMENCVELGLAKCIGVSNFNSQQIQAILDCCKIKPVTNQVECHPYLPQNKLREFCKHRGIVLINYRPLGGQATYIKKDLPNISKDEVIETIATKHGKQPSQILLRWHLQQNFIVLVKSSTFKHIDENLNIFDFDLDTEDMEKLQKLENNIRYCPFLDSTSSKQYPFHIQY